MAHIQITIANGNIEAETKKAIKFDFGWMPKSQIVVNLDTHYDATGTVFIPVWLAKKNNLGWGDGIVNSDELQEMIVTGKLRHLKS